MKTGKAIVWSSKSRRPFDREEVTRRTEGCTWEKTKEDAMGPPFLVVGRVQVRRFF